jgi:hypothetical protein
MNEEQYKVLSQRRIALNNLIWQTPTLGMAAQAFLLAAAFNPQIERTTALILLIFSLFVGLASIQLMIKHRYHEVIDSELMAAFEATHAEEGYSVIHRPGAVRTSIKRPWPARISSYRLWLTVLTGFCLIALYGLYSKL